MVRIRKPNGELHMCMDPKDLNKNTKRKHQIPTRNKIMSELAGAKNFSYLDTSRLLAVETTVHEDGTFNTPYGHCYFRSLSFGINSAPKVYKDMRKDTGQS